MDGEHGNQISNMWKIHKRTLTKEKKIIVWGGGVFNFEPLGVWDTWEHSCQLSHPNSINILNSKEIENALEGTSGWILVLKLERVRLKIEETHKYVQMALFITI